MKNKILFLLSVSLILSCTGCNEKNKQSSSYNNHALQTEKSNADTSNNTTNNFLGGNGELKIIDELNTLVLQDDEWIYIGSKKLKTNDSSTHKLVSQCREAGCTHSSSSCILNQYYSGESMLMSDGKTLYLAQSNRLFTVNSNGSMQDFLLLEKDNSGVSLNAETVQFDLLKYVDESHIYVSAYGYTTKDEYVEMNFIYDYNSSRIHYIDSKINSYYTCFDSATNIFYCIGTDCEIIKINLSDMQEEIATKNLDDFLTYDGWLVNNNILYYINQMGQYCKYDFTSSNKTLLYDISPFYTFNVHDDKIYTIDSKHTSILYGDAEWNEWKTLYTSDTTIQGITAISDSFVLFNCDNGARVLFLSNGEVVKYETE